MENISSFLSYSFSPAARISLAWRRTSELKMTFWIWWLEVNLVNVFKVLKVASSFSVLALLPENTQYCSHEYLIRPWQYMAKNVLSVADFILPSMLILRNKAWRKDAEIKRINFWADLFVSGRYNVSQISQRANRIFVVKWFLMLERNQFVTRSRIFI